ncbi:isochorismatase family protein [Bordetella genomosp. 13]|uniref:isochorismatase family protein n=1 Tax=Bordetella genomosp. 13 TaxID=463040 RepID=UPI0011AA48F0|nr:isochorismatase family protein [Bordetella genomosp. 13]
MSDIYQRQAFGQTLGFGVSTAMLIIDFQMGYTREDKLGGFNINDAIASTGLLLDAARQAGIPVAHVRFVSAPGGTDIGTFGMKVPTLQSVTEDSPDAQFVPRVAPIEGEYVSIKRHGSAFFGTTLASWLMGLRVDTLLVTGCTTSGCVRASVCDASAYGLRPIVVRDCVGDRAEIPHEANLFDMQQKYADVIGLDEALSHLRAGQAA